jgi:hypothetical protein
MLKNSKNMSLNNPIATVTHTCEYCGKDFVTEKTLINHACEKRRRWLWQEEKYVKLGFYAYRKFYKTVYINSKKEKTYKDFMNSRYYTGFTKFGRYILDISAVDPEGFIDFVIKLNVKLTDWTAEHVYETYIRELNKKESPDRAVERNILLMIQWSKDNNEPWNDFFRKVNPQLATRWIKMGRISPWLLYTGFGSDLFSRMSDEQLNLVKDVIDPVFWSKKVAINKNDVDYIKNILKSAGV